MAGLDIDELAEKQVVGRKHLVDRRDDIVVSERLDFRDDSRELYRIVLVMSYCEPVYLPVICSASWLFSLQIYSQISSPGARSATCFTFQGRVKVPVSS